MATDPDYYKGELDCIQVIDLITYGKPADEAVRIANVVKYLWRYPDKNGLEDVEKAGKYIEMLIELLKSKQ